MQYRRHPKRLREFLFVLLPFTLACLCAFVWRAAADAAPLLSRIAEGAGIVMLMWCFYLLAFRSNVTRCPTCGRKLTRPRRSTDFVCTHCDITWQCRDRTN